MQIIVRPMNSLRTDKRGVAALEYAILAGLLAVVIVAAVTSFGASLSTAFTNLGTTLTNVTAPK